ncbi:DUF1491 family protein [Allosphingosinicella vermicomposti]|uniref:DUF1491 family protein n=1 Tax=Allosphingosinicella vermicomposti TaxID=614671 RepID=UPI00131A4E80|nr:DUF1491 family protein [Allosphingosinicella vermicomposti]
MIAGVLLRLAARDGGFGAVLSKGDEQAGEIIVLLLEKGRKRAILERILQPNGDYCWHPADAKIVEDEDKFQDFLARRTRFDPDLWLIELDIASAERFAAEMNALN